MGGRARETRDHPALPEAADFSGVALDDGLAEADLAVAADDGAAALADEHDRCRVPNTGLCAFRTRAILHEATENPLPSARSMTPAGWLQGHHNLPQGWPMAGGLDRSRARFHG